MSYIEESFNSTRELAPRQYLLMRASDTINITPAQQNQHLQTNSETLIFFPHQKHQLLCLCLNYFLSMNESIKICWANMLYGKSILFWANKKKAWIMINHHICTNWRRQRFNSGILQRYKTEPIANLSQASWTAF